MNKSLIFCVVICFVFCLAGCNSNTAEETEPIKFITDTSFPAGNAETKPQASEETVLENEPTDVQELNASSDEETKAPDKAETSSQSASPTQTPSRPTDESKAEQSSTQSQTTSEAKPKEPDEQPKEENTTAEEKPAEPEPTEPPQAQFDVSPYVSYAKEYAVSIGLELDNTATECWDNPISANPNRSGIKSDIQNRLNRYKNSEGFTAVWIWAEKVSETEYEIYIGYC